MAIGWLKHCFEPFFTTKKEGEGTGLGLAMVYGCAQAHDGWVYVHSELGRGSTFRFYLPAVAVERDATTEQARPIPRGTERLLLVDDAEAALLLGRSILENCGYRIVTAAGTEEALALLDDPEQKIDLVVSDLVMPDRGGRELLRAMRERGIDLPVILASGHVIQQRSKEALASEFAAFVSKPFDARILAESVRWVLDANLRGATS